MGNFGDDISIPILQKLFSIEPRHSSMRDAELICAGSVLDAFCRRGRKKIVVDTILGRSRDLHVWGSGAMRESSSLWWPQRMHFHAVRGSLSAARIPSFNGVLGDPGILANLLLDKEPPLETTATLVPHYVDEAFSNTLQVPRGWTVTHPDNECLSVVRQIGAAEIVVSSSLHGLIVADSFRRPAVWARAHGVLAHNSDYKFHDYASARGTPLNSPISYETALSMSLPDLAQLATVPSRSINEWQKELIKSFPLR